MLYALCNGIPVCSAIISQISCNHLPTTQPTTVSLVLFPVSFRRQETLELSDHPFSPLYIVYKI